MNRTRRAPDASTSPAASNRPRLTQWLRPSDCRPALCWIVHYGRTATCETILDVAPGSLRYRRRSDRNPPGPWRRRRLALNRPHAVAFMPDGTVVVADTDHDRLVILERINGGWVRSRRCIAGIVLHRPHYVLFNPLDLHLYVLDAHGLYRMRSPLGPGDVWQISGGRLGYARALAVLDGRIHIIASNLGTVLRVDDFPERRLRQFRSHGKRRVAPAGSWSRTGLVLNDVAQVGGWYYGTNYFSPDYAEKTDARPLRLMRWRTWTDFRRGQWQDLSACLPSGLVPYFFTTIASRLFLSAFCHADHRRDGVFILTA